MSDFRTIFGHRKNEHMQIVLECFEMCLKCVGVKEGRAVMIFLKSYHGEHPSFL